MASLTIDLTDLLTKAGCTQALIDVARERVRQVQEKGWTPEHDDAEHDVETLASAAMAFAQSSFSEPDEDPEDVGFWWPFEEPMKRKTPREDLVRAGAMILAAIEFIDRAAS
jgi:hypothetical protein